MLRSLCLTSSTLLSISRSLSIFVNLAHSLTNPLAPQYPEGRNCFTYRLPGSICNQSKECATAVCAAGTVSHLRTACLVFFLLTWPDPNGQCANCTGGIFDATTNPNSEKALSAKNQTEWCIKCNGGASDAKCELCDPAKAYMCESSNDFFGAEFAAAEKKFKVSRSVGKSHQVDCRPPFYPMPLLLHPSTDERCPLPITVPPSRSTSRAASLFLLPGTELCQGWLLRYCGEKSVSSPHI